MDETIAKRFESLERRVLFLEEFLMKDESLTIHFMRGEDE